MSVHKEKTVSVLSRAIQSVLSRGLNDPRVRGMMTVTDVKVSDDMANATVMVSVFPEEAAELTVHGLCHAAQHIRTEVGNSVRIRRMPHLTFKVDRRLKRESSVLSAINEAVRADEERAARRVAGEDDNQRTRKVKP